MRRQDSVPLAATHASRAERALASLVSHGLKSEVPALVDELFASEKRALSFLALIPVVGLLLIHGSERHTEQEKRKLSWLSVGLTLLLVALLWTLQPNSQAQGVRLQQRIEREIRTLRNIAEQYRTQHGSYPSEATWRRFTERADARFFDPWGRPYRYELQEGGSVVLGTLGQDALEGGRGRDADVSTEQRPLPEDAAALQ